MHRDVIISCLPLLIALVASVATLPLLARLSGARLDLSRLRRVHGDELGGVQSLSFVLTLPLFIMIMMFIVQLSQLTIAKIVVEYSAYAAARSAQVWIPATFGSGYEQENRIGMRLLEGTISGTDDQPYEVFLIESGGRKYNKIHLAAATALMPICPSRDVSASRDHAGNAAADAMISSFRAIAPATSSNTRIPTRIRNKLAYALENTEVTIEIAHKEDEPPLQHYDIPPDREEFTPDEAGWQDQVAVTVVHNFALLPGPGRLLARPAPSPQSGFTQESSRNAHLTDTIQRINGVYIYPLRATVRVNNEGEQSVLPYAQAEYGIP